MLRRSEETGAITGRTSIRSAIGHSSLVTASEGIYRIQLCRLVCRNEAGGHGDRKQSKRKRNEQGDIDPAVCEQEHSDESRRCQSNAEPDDNPYDHDYQTLFHDQSEDVASLRADREANADFSRSPARRVVDD